MKKGKKAMKNISGGGGLVKNGDGGKEQKKATAKEAEVGKVLETIKSSAKNAAAAEVNGSGSGAAAMTVVDAPTAVVENATQATDTGNTVVADGIESPVDPAGDESGEVDGVESAI